MINDTIQTDIAAVSNVAAVPTILEVVCRTTGLGFAAIARVTEERWVACSVRDEIAFGLQPGGELKIETTICNEIRQHGELVVINHVAEDETYCTHHTPALYGFQSYISMPITLPNGTFFGTLCAIDPRPAQLNRPEIIGMFRLFAELIAFHLDANEQMALSQLQLREERKISELREQFIAVLGHDLRNPLGAISAGAALLKRMPLDERSHGINSMIQDCVSRMTELIENVLDFARSRLGGGLMLNRNADAPLEPVIHQVVEEMRMSWPDRLIEIDCALSDPIYCDRRRIAQLLSNLLGNALTYGARGTPVRIKAISFGNTMQLSVANAGEPIPPAAMQRLFQPFSRGEIQSNQQGLGLGLYIASEIAHAHGGELTVTSTPEETCFTLRMPAL